MYYIWRWGTNGGGKEDISYPYSAAKYYETGKKEAANKALTEYKQQYQTNGEPAKIE